MVLVLSTCSYNEAAGSLQEEFSDLPFDAEIFQGREVLGMLPVPQVQQVWYNLTWVPACNADVILCKSYTRSSWQARKLEQLLHVNQAELRIRLSWYHLHSGSWRVSYM